MHILQVGTHTGRDKVYEFVCKNHNSIKKCVLVDINEAALAKARERYSNFNFIEIKNIGVLPIDIEDKVTFFSPKVDKESEYCGLSKDHIIAHQSNHGGLDSFSVSCKSLSSLLRENPSTTHLFIDTEGLDALLLLSVNWDEFCVKEIVFEFIHTDGILKNSNRLQAIGFYLNKFGYHFTQLDAWNLKAERAD